MDFDTKGTLTAGFHDCTYEEFYEAFVSAFPSSQRRESIANALLDFSAEVFAVGTPIEFWIDGSYATNKMNPNDADIILFFLQPHMATLGPLWPSFRKKYEANLDIYFAYAVCPENEKIINPQDYQNNVVNNRNYWRGQFGFDRQDNPKGIIRIDCKSIQEALKRR